MFILKKISSLMIIAALLAGSSGLNAVSTQDKKKIAERKAKRTKEKTKGKAKPQTVKKPLSARPVAVQKPAAVKKPLAKTVTTVYPVQQRDTVKDVASNYYGGATTVQTTLPSVSVPYAKPLPDLPMPTDMPAILERNELMAMLPNHLKDRVDTIIMTTEDANLLFKNIYLLGWVDDQLMNKFNEVDFYAKLRAVIAQERNMPYAGVEKMTSAIKDQVDSTLTSFENAIITGDKAKANVQPVRDLFGGADSYKEYLERCLRLAQEYKQSSMVTVLKLAIANAGTPYSPAEEEDFNY